MSRTARQEPAKGPPGSCCRGTSVFELRRKKAAGITGRPISRSLGSYLAPVYRRYLVCGHTVSLIENGRRFDCDLRNTCDGRHQSCRHWLCRKHHGPFRRRAGSCWQVRCGPIGSCTYQETSPKPIIPRGSWRAKPFTRRPRGNAPLHQIQWGTAARSRRLSGIESPTARSNADGPKIGSAGRRPAAAGPGDHLRRRRSRANGELGQRST